jgi:hypothetical protein
MYKIMDWSSPQGAKLLEQTAQCGHLCQFEPSRMAMKLSEMLPEQNPLDLHAALDIVLSRRRAGRLGDWADQALLTAQSVEQASRLEVAAHHAEQFRNCEHILEIGTGAGSDTAALAKVTTKITSIEANPSLAQMARHNLALQGINNVIILDGCAEDVLSNLDLQTFDGLWSDPSRRDDQGNRIKNPADYRPSLNLVMTLRVNGPRGIKVSPALNIDPLAPGWAREFIGVADECIEQTLWSGTNIADGTLCLADRAIIWAPAVEAALPEILGTDELPTGFLVEPHNALIRTGYLGSWFAQNECRVIDDKIAYGIRAIQLPVTELAQSFKIIESFDFNIRQIGARLRELNWTNQTEIKMRGFPESPETIRQKLKLPPSSGKEDPSGVVILTRRGESHLAIIAIRDRQGRS